MDDKFGPVGAAPAGGDSLDYFGGTPASTPGASAPSQFGAVAPPAAPFGAPSTYAAQPPPPPKKRGVPKPAIVLIVLVVAAVGFFGWNGMQRSQPITMPATFNGLAVDAEPAAQNALQSTLASMHMKNKDIVLNGQIYGTGTDAVMVAAARARDKVEDDLAGSGLQAPVVVGSSTCAQATHGDYSVCVRTEANLTVVVVMLTGKPSETAALVDQAWTMF